MVWIPSRGAFGPASIVNDGHTLLGIDSFDAIRYVRIAMHKYEQEPWNAASSQAKVDVRHWLPEPGASLKSMVQSLHLVKIT